MNLLLKQKKNLILVVTVLWVPGLFFCKIAVYIVKPFLIIHSGNAYEAFSFETEKLLLKVVKSYPEYLYFKYCVFTVSTYR